MKKASATAIGLACALSLSVFAPSMAVADSELTTAGVPSIATASIDEGLTSELSEDGTLCITYDGSDEKLLADPANTYDVSDKALVKKIVLIGENLTWITGSVFAGFENLETIDLSQTGIDSIIQESCANNPKLETVVLPTGRNVSISDSSTQGCAFANCPKLEILEWMDSSHTLEFTGVLRRNVWDPQREFTIRTIHGDIPLKNCLADGSAFIVSEDGKSAELSYVGVSAQRNTIAISYGDTVKTSVNRIVVNEGVSSIGSQAFEDWTGLESISLPTSITSIAGEAFRGCSALNSLDLSNTQIESLDYSGNMIFNAAVETVYLPKTLKSVGQSAFTCAQLKTVVFAEDGSFETIGANSFQISGIEDLVLPDTVKTIGSQAFASCTSLKSVSLPATVESVDTNAFEGSNLFLSEGELIVRGTCAIPAALKDKSFKSVVKPALEHSFTTYGVAEPAEGAEAPEGLVLHRACAVCGELDPDAEDVSVDELLKQTADEAAAEVAQAACEAAGIAYDASKSAEENVAAAKAAVEQSAAEEATAKAAAKAAQGKADNPMTVKAKVVKAKAKKKTTIKRPKAFQVAGAKGALTFAKLSGSAKVIVSKAGKVTVKKGLKKGKTYKVKVLVCDAGNKDYAPAFKTVTLKVKVK